MSGSRPARAAARRWSAGCGAEPLVPHGPLWIRAWSGSTPTTPRPVPKRGDNRPTGRSRLPGGCRPPRRRGTPVHRPWWRTSSVRHGGGRCASSSPRRAVLAVARCRRGASPARPTPLPSPTAHPARRCSRSSRRCIRAALMAIAAGTTTSTRWSSTQCSTSWPSNRTSRPTLTIGMRRSATSRRMWRRLVPSRSATSSMVRSADGDRISPHSAQHKERLADRGGRPARARPLGRPSPSGAFRRPPSSSTPVVVW